MLAHTLMLVLVHLNLAFAGRKGLESTLQTGEQRRVVGCLDCLCCPCSLVAAAVVCLAETALAIVCCPVACCLHVDVAIDDALEEAKTPQVLVIGHNAKSDSMVVDQNEIKVEGVAMGQHGTTSEGVAMGQHGIRSDSMVVEHRQESKDIEPQESKDSEDVE